MPASPNASKTLLKSALDEAARLLEKLNPDQFELYAERASATSIEVKDNQVDGLKQSEDVGLAVRLVKDQRPGFSFTTSLAPDSVRRAVETAFEVASNMPEDPHAGLFSFGSAVYPEVDTLDVRGPKTALAHKIDLARSLEASCRAADARIKGIRSAALRESTYEVMMRDSGGEGVSHQSTLYTASITCKAEEGPENAKDAQMGHDFAFSNHLDGLEIASVGKLAAARACELLGATQAPTLRCPAVLRNDVVAELVDFLSSHFSAEEIDKGRSMLGGKRGERLFSERVTLIDDGLLAGGYATSPFDGEGIPSQRTTLVDGGFVSAFLYDGYNARKHGAEPTGSSSRSIKSPPTIGATNLYMAKGTRAPDELLDGIERGIFITDLMGVHTANPVTGDFSLGASGILIENGRLARPVKGFAVAGNVLELFRKMSDVGSDLRFFGSVGAPSVRVTDLSIGGK